LIETDGPYTKMNSRVTTPQDLYLVINDLAEFWQRPVCDVRKIIMQNERTILKDIS